jgi:hypothetical protein
MYQDKCIFFCRLPIIFVGGGKTDREIWVSSCESS